MRKRALLVTAMAVCLWSEVAAADTWVKLVCVKTQGDSSWYNTLRFTLNLTTMKAWEEGAGPPDDITATNESYRWWAFVLDRTTLTLSYGSQAQWQCSREQPQL